MSGETIYLSKTQSTWLNSQLNKSKAVQELIDKMMKEEENHEILEEKITKRENKIAELQEENNFDLKKLKIIYGENKEKQQNDKAKLELLEREDKIKKEQRDDLIEKMPYFKEFIKLRPKSALDEIMSAFQRKLVYDGDYHNIARKDLYEYLFDKGYMKVKENKE